MLPAAMSYAQIAPAALQLPPHERAVLAESLWASLEDPYYINAGEDETLRLAEQRDQELESGAMAPLSHEELMRRLRA